MNRFTSRLLVSSTVATTLTGAGYFWAKYLVRADDPWAAINHPLEPWFLKAHIVVVPILLFALGLFVAQHVSRHYALGTLRGRRSGVAITLLIGPMVVTGYLIQVLTHRGWLQSMAIAHIVLGSIYALGFGLHYLIIGGEKRPAKREVREIRGGLVDFGTEPESVTGVRLQTPAKRRATAPAPSHAARSTTGR